MSIIIKYFEKYNRDGKSLLINVVFYWTITAKTLYPLYKTQPEKTLNFVST